MHHGDFDEYIWKVEAHEFETPLIVIYLDKDNQKEGPGTFDVASTKEKLNLDKTWKAEKWIHVGNPSHEEV